MTLRPVQPIRHPIDSRVSVPASPAEAVAELALSALCDGRSEIDLGPRAAGRDVATMIDVLAALGLEVQGGASGVVIVTARPGGAPAEATLAVGDSLDAARFAVALAAARPGSVRIEGGEGSGAALAALALALRRLGAQVEGDAFPITVAGPLRGGRVELTGSAAGEVAEPLVAVAPLTERGIELRVDTSASYPGIDRLLAMLEGRGARIERLGGANAYWIGPQRLKGRSLRISGDSVAGAYSAAAAAILGGRVTVDNVDPHRPDQPGLRAFELLEEMGCRVSRFFGGITLRRGGALYGIRRDLRSLSDLFPLIAVVGACASGRTEIVGVGRPQRPEGDRVRAVAEGLRALGGRVTEYADGLAIDPVPLHGGVIEATDIRVAMAFSILGLSVPGVSIETHDGGVDDAYPGFYAMLQDLGH